MAGNFKLLNLIGSGTYGEAWLAKCLKNDSKCVVKVIKILKLTEKELDRSLTEVSILARCNHPNIISYLDAYVNEGCLNIAMEYADGGIHKTMPLYPLSTWPYIKLMTICWVDAEHQTYIGSEKSVIDVYYT